VGDYVGLRGAALGPWKLVENRVPGTLELYHLDEDPREQRILFDRLGDAPPMLFHALELRAPHE
jgi:hypothetical protein